MWRPWCFRPAFVLAALLAGTVHAGAHDGLDERIEDLGQRIAADAGDPTLRMRRADLHRRHGDWGAAMDDLDRAEQLGAKPDRIAFQRGQVYLDMGQPGETLRVLAPVTASQDPPVPTLFLVGRAHAEQGHTDAASDAFAAALARCGRPLPEYYLEHAGAFTSADVPRMAEALAILEDGISRLGDLVSLHETAFVIERTSDPQAAVERARRVNALPGGANPLWLVREGEVLLELGRTEEARAAFLRVAEFLAGTSPRRRGSPAMLKLAAQVQRHLAPGGEGAAAE